MTVNKPLTGEKKNKNFSNSRNVNYCMWQDMTCKKIYLESSHKSYHPVERWKEQELEEEDGKKDPMMI